MGKYNYNDITEIKKKRHITATTYLGNRFNGKLIFWEVIVSGFLAKK
jgi:hypothetical protein